MSQAFHNLTVQSRQILALLVVVAVMPFLQGNWQRHETSGKQSQVTGVKQQSTKKDLMTLYLTRFSYTPDTWARMMKNPEDRSKAAQKYIESVGGRLTGFWYAFGEFDGYCLWEAPDNVSMAAVELAIRSGGAVSKLETNILLTVDQTLEALRRASSIQYRPPAKQ